MADTQAWMDPEGGREDPERPPAVLDNPLPVMTGRDAQTDCRTISEIEGQMTDELDMAGYLVETRVQTIGNEIRRMGWTKLTSPSGGIPAPGSTSGGRGADDIGKI